MIEVDAIILASGLSRRMGTNKLLLPLGKKALVEKFLDSFPFGDFHETIFVYSDRAVATLVSHLKLTLCKNTNPGEGQSRAIREGLGFSRARDGLMFFVADQPLLSPDTITTLLARFQDRPESIVVPRVDGKNRNPVIFPACFRNDLSLLKGDVGGRKVIQQNQGKVSYQDFDCAQEFVDVDTLEHYSYLVNLCRDLP